MLFQDPGTPLMEGIVDFHHDIMFIIIFIVVTLLFMITVIVRNFTQTENNETKTVMRGSHHAVITFIPTFINANIFFDVLGVILYSVGWYFFYLFWTNSKVYKAKITSFYDVLKKKNL
tara:strand:+ start:286 stop:639 length:354 start_codon:yes stop_codon:yes gene_type:complete